MSDRYMVLFLGEEQNPDGSRYLAIPSHRGEDDEYEDRLEDFVRANHPALFAFAERYGTALDFTKKSSAVVLELPDEEIAALLKLEFETELVKVKNYDRYRADMKRRYEERVREQELQEYRRVKARYLELKAKYGECDD